VPDLEAPSYREAIDDLHRRLDEEHTDLMNRVVLARDWLIERLVADRRRNLVERDIVGVPLETLILFR
jgi:hypothetical protein